MSEEYIEKIDDMSESVLQDLLNLVFKHTGITMNTSKKMLLQGRIRPRMKILGIKTYSDYIEYLNVNSEENQSFINMVTTNETSFFRTKRIWDYFNQQFLVNWVKSNPNKTLNIWSGAAATGEEIYSIAMSCEEFKSKHIGFDYSILATDISTQVLNIAKSGFYQGRNIVNFKEQYPQLFCKYFIEKDDGFIFHNDNIRKKIEFTQHNLLTKLQKSNFLADIIFLRNVLIYFEVKEIETILEKISFNLIPNGTLIIGESESLSRTSSKFKFSEPQIYLKGEST